MKIIVFSLLVFVSSNAWAMPEWQLDMKLRKIAELEQDIFYLKEDVRKLKAALEAR